MSAFKVGVASAVALLIFSSLLYALVVGNENEQPLLNSVETIKVSSCIPDSFGTELDYQQSNMYDCLYEGILQSASDGDKIFNNDTAFLENYANKDSIFANICHLASHDAGSAYAKQTTPAEALTLTTDFCFSGFVHGVFDFIGSSEKASMLWAPAAETCEFLSEKRPMACADGLGHASWDYFKNAEDAFGNCEIFTSTSKITECSEGVVMQMFAPAVVKPSSNILQRPSNLSEVCDNAASVHAVKGCFLGLGWLLGNDVATTSAPYLGQVNYPKDKYNDLQEIFTKNSNVCLRLSKGSSDCLNRFYTSIPFPLWKEESVRSLLCNSLPLSKEACLATANSMVGSSQ